MSSPSSSSSNKRKRGGINTVSDRVKSSTVEHQQPSSRDASGEEMAGESPAANTRHRKQLSQEQATGLPPSKRARTKSNASPSAPSAITSLHNNEHDPVAAQDPGEPSSTTEDSADIEKRSKRRSSRAASVNGKKLGNGDDKDNSDAKVDDVVESIKAAPKIPKAGMRDPVGGFKTNPPPVGRPVRVYADGVFDLFHLGHMRQLQQAKMAFPDTYLIVGVTGDAETHRRKGLTVLTGQERAESVFHCKWVDEVIPNCPWIITPEFLHKHKIDYVAHDDEPYGATEGDDIYTPIKKEGKFLVTERTEGVSTTGIITKIVKDYEKYIARQLKRGTSRQELNVSWLKKNELDIKRHMGELRNSIKQNWTSAGGEIGRDLKQFWQNAGIQLSRPTSPSPSLRNAYMGGEKGLAPGDAASISGAKSPPLEHLKHLDIPRPQSPFGRLGRSDDFAAGYSLGLLGSVRSWMSRSRRSLNDSQHNSPEGTDEEDLRSPTSEQGEPLSPTSSRGRKGRSDEERLDTMEVMH